jgi:hypothetical protein
MSFGNLFNYWNVVLKIGGPNLARQTIALTQRSNHEDHEGGLLA